MAIRISVIIPAYNAARFLHHTLDSVLAQTVSEWELIVVDDGSQDETVAAATAYAVRDSRIHVLTQPNGGVAAARNTGLAAAHPESEFVVFLDHDDLWRTDTLETLMAALDAAPNAVGAHGLALLVEGPVLERGFQTWEGDQVDWQRRKIVRRWGRPRVVECRRTEPTTFAVQAYDGCVCTPGLMLARKTAVAQAGPFDPAMWPCDDWDMWVRLSLLGDAVFIDEILLNWRVHGGNASLDKPAMGRGVSQIRRKMFQLPGMTSEQRLLAHWRYRRMYASVVRHNAADCLRWAAENLSRRHWKDAARFLAQGLAHYGSYLPLSLFWHGLTDRGPIPLRLKDTVPNRKNHYATPASQRCDPLL